MKTHKHITLVPVIIILVFSLLAHPSPVYAALAVTGVSPNILVNDVSTSISVTGTDFTDLAIVYLGTTALSTTYVSPTSVTALVPPGMSPGPYDVIVDIPGTGSATLPGGLTLLAPTATPQPFARPQIVIDMYTFSVSAIVYGQEFNLNVSLDNAGGSTAYGMQIILSSSNLLMLKNGGVVAAGSLGTAGKVNFTQTMTASASLYGLSVVSVDMNVTYYDEIGTAYSEKFTIHIPVGTSSSGTGRVYATSTPTGVRKSQLVITSYSTDIVPLQPGAIFNLDLVVENLGTIDAKSVTMIIGGSSAGGGGTPAPGVDAGSGEFTNFAPVGTSNVKSLGDIPSGKSQVASQSLIVNVSTNPGAYPMRISFVYTDSTGAAVTDEQVITLLVYRLPQVEIGFYQPVGELYAGQPGMLPLQVVNLGRATVVLGMMTVESEEGIIENGEMLIGALDSGGYFPLDAMITPEAAGTLEFTITIEYTDDFSQPRTITQTLSVEVIEAPFEPIPEEGIPIEPMPESSDETFWHKVWRFILGLLGLDSGLPSPSYTTTEVPMELFPAEPATDGGKG